ncbi:choice-of-anchor M domain-containing protein [Actinotignum urinale]|uniref:choice-of-anchor M domain-containing protein n=1 Tax=Actinotignum urinale TaxID=190146 RepID=UPI002A817BF8|nr:choice-of-anchor M domain-containing protein [Actinotignum urinale]MDY5151846.1 choice-of-anchor M domain-containing protein [Actinotignum urinale]
MKITRAIATATTLFTALLPLASTPAFADTETGTPPVVATQSHVDAPKTFWENNTFTLKSELRGKLYPLEKTINWVGKGYGNRNKRQQYIWNMPSDPAIQILKKHGERWYRAPSVPQGHDPIWAGFGADSNIPKDSFRDAAFSLDIVGFEGPGRMEMFNYYEGFLNRYLSSHETWLRSAFLTAGEHSHNETLFTKPGRYKILYRTTARDKATGKIISSPTTPLAWQVGGNNPESDSPIALHERFAQARESADSSTKQATYTFSMKPHAGGANDGDEQLTDLSFQASDTNISGTVAFLIDGYHLAEVPVNNGVATWSEMIGSGSSQFQAVFIPAENSGAKPWASQPMTYEFEQGEVSTDSETGDAQIMQAQTQDPAPAFTAKEYTPSNYSVTTTSRPLTDDKFETRIQMGDPKAHVRITGGYYSSESAAAPDCPIEGYPNEQGILSFTNDRECEGGMLKLNVTPHPLVKASSGTVTGKNPLDSEVEQHESGTFNTWDKASGPTDQPSEKPSPSATPTTTPTTKPDGSPSSTPSAQPSPKPSPSATPTPDSGTTHLNILDSKVLLSKGHVDIQAHMANGKFVALLHDDTLEHATTSVNRTLDSVALAMDDSTKQKRPTTGIFAKPEANFLPAEFYYTDQSWDGHHIWPGWSTVGLPADVKDPVLEISPATTPQGGGYHLFTVDGLRGEINHLIDSAAGKTTMQVPVGTHAHASWAFTKPGVYKLNVRYTALVNGTRTQTEPQQLTFLVGNTAIADYKAGKVTSGEKKPSSEKGTTTNGSSSSANSSGSGNVSAPQGDTSATAMKQIGAAMKKLASPKPATKKVCKVTTKVGDSHTIPANTHVHPNWVFTKEGTYKVRITQTATLKNGTKVSAPMTLTFNVGGQGNANEGHYDAGAAISGEKLRAVIKDPSEKWHDNVESFSFGLGAKAQATAPEGIDFIAKKGEKIWMISSAQVAGVPWLGVNTMHPSLVSETTGGVTWKLESVDGPGAMAVFTSGNLGAVVGEKWFGGLSTSCSNVGASGGNLANTGVKITGISVLALVLLSLGGSTVAMVRKQD